MEGRRKPKIADWLMFLRSAVPYCFFETGPHRPREAFKEMIEALLLILDATADYDPTDPETTTHTCRVLRAKVARALFKLERDFPTTELSIAIHELIHIADFLFRYNAVRNFWCFVVERLVGFMKTFIKNRSLAVENLVHITHLFYYILAKS
jgi:hypothetical protein